MSRWSHENSQQAEAIALYSAPENERETVARYFYRQEIGLLPGKTRYAGVESLESIHAPQSRSQKVFRCTSEEQGKYNPYSGDPFK